MEIAERVIVVTGASTGIGLATAQHLARNGARLVLAARDAERLAAVADSLPDALAVPTDVTQPDAAPHLVEQTISHYGRIDVLVNNAGRAMARPVETINLEEYSELLTLNLIAPLRLMQLVIPWMRSQGGGQIVNISSQASTKYIPHIAGYASTKAALNTLALTARAELAQDGILVSIVKPGIVDTDFGAHTASPEPDALRRSPAGDLLPHVLSPAEVAHAVAVVIQTGQAEYDLVRD